VAVINKKRIQGIAKRNKENGQGKNGVNDIQNSSRMINASRAFRNLPPEMTMGKEYDGGNSLNRTSMIGEKKEL
jgi:hypothetical protein